MRRIKPLIRDIPFVMLLMDGILFMAALCNGGFWIYDLMPQLSGHGILLVFYAGYFARVHRFCIYTWICLGTLAAINVLNIIHFWVGIAYYETYLCILIYPILFMYVVYRIRQRNAPDKAAV